jgi:hypothetical protein
VPPEQLASDQFWTFAVFTGALVVSAVRTILLAGSATTVDADAPPDIFAERIGGATAGPDA